MPINVALNHVAQAATTMSAQGWEVVLPPTMIPTGSKLVGGARNMLWVFWVRCPADSPLCGQDCATPAGMLDPRQTSGAELHGLGREAVPA